MSTVVWYEVGMWAFKLAVLLVVGLMATGLLWYAIDTTRVRFKRFRAERNQRSMSDYLWDDTGGPFSTEEALEPKRRPESIDVAWSGDKGYLRTVYPGADDKVEMTNSGKKTYTPEITQLGYWRKKWCFKCRKHIRHQKVRVNDYSGYLGSYIEWRCPTCGEDNTKFPGRE